MIDQLNSMDRAGLVKLAGQKGILVVEEMTQEDLIEAIEEAIEEDHLDAHDIINDAALIAEKKFELTDPVHVEPADNSTFSLPTSYNETFIMFILRDPDWAYCYWELKDNLLNDLRDDHGVNLVLRVQGSNVVSSSDETDSYDIPVKLTDSSWYINLPQRGWKYYIELMLLSGTHQTMITRSNTIYTPKACVAESGGKMSLDSVDELIGLSGLTRIGESAYDKMIPQRIISMLKDKYIQNS